MRRLSSVHLRNDLKTKISICIHNSACHGAMSGDTHEEETQSQPGGRESHMRQTTA